MNYILTTNPKHRDEYPDGTTYIYIDSKNQSKVTNKLQDLSLYSKIHLTDIDYELPVIRVSTLSIHNYPHKIDFTKFPNLTTLDLGDYNFPIDVNTLKLEILNMDNYTLSIDFSKIPTLICLHMGFHYKNSRQPKLDGLKLQYFGMNRWHTKHIDLTSQTKLRTLEMSLRYNCPIDFSLFPSLRALYIGHEFNQPIDFSQLPLLKILKVSKSYKHPIDLKNSIVTKLILSSELSAPIELPKNITIQAQDSKSVFKVSGYDCNILKDLHNAFPLCRFYIH